ncbi:MAG: outer membrane protein [Nitrospiraceae bacterium]
MIREDKQRSLYVERIGRWITMVPMILGLLIFLPLTGIGAENEQGPTTAQDSSKSTSPETTPQTSSGTTEVYLSLSVIGSNPVNRPLKLEGDAFPGATVGGGLGAGIKAGAFPAAWGGYVGLEGEFYGINGDVNALQSTVGGVTRSARATLNVFNTMVNILFRYPGEIIQPYVGAGVGLSGGFARDLNIQHSQLGNVNENAGDAAFAFQLIGGVRANVGDRWFLFSEYKYFGANYNWQSELPNGANGPAFSLNYRTHLVSGGIGLRF